MKAKSLCYVGTVSKCEPRRVGGECFALSSNEILGLWGVEEGTLWQLAKIKP